jgi:hypothetical protein
MKNKQLKDLFLYCKTLVNKIQDFKKFDLYLREFWR